MSFALHINLLGRYEVTLHDGVPLTYPTSKVQALLAYLVMEPRVHDRSKLAGLLWSDIPERSARNNLRQTLFRLRKTLGERDGAERFLQLSRQSVVWAPAGPVQLDVDQFLTARQGCSLHQGQSLANCSKCQQHLEKAARLYQGDFLTDLPLDDSSLYAEWAEMQRSYLHRQAMQTIEKVTDWLVEQNQFEASAVFARRLAELDPYHEVGQQKFIRSLAYCGRLGEALAEARQFVTLLDSEVGSEPTLETQELIKQLQAGTLAPPVLLPLAPPLTVTPKISLSPGKPGNSSKLLGREQVLQTLNDWWARDDCHFVVLAGQAGIGKSALAEALLTSEPTLLKVDLQSRSLQLQMAEIKAYLSNSALAYPVLFLDNADNLDYEEIEAFRLEHNIKLIVTRCQRFNTHSAWELQVNALSMAAATDAAPQLFRQLSLRSGQTLACDEQSDQMIVTICQLVEGNPAAILLVVKWLRFFTLAELVAELQEAPFSLIGESGPSDPAGRGLLPRFGQQWRGMSPAYQAKVSVLTMFSGGFTRQAAQAIAGVSLADLTSLVEAGILISMASGRYRLSRLWHNYLQNSVDTRPHLSHRSAFIDYYAAFLLEMMPKLRCEQDRPVLQQMQAEFENLWLAWDWGWQERSFDALLDLVDGLASYCDMSGQFSRGQNAFQSVLAVELEIPDELAGRLNCWLGWLQFQAGELRQALQGLYKGARLLRSTDSRWLSRSLARYAIVAGALGDDEAAEIAAQESLAAAESIGDWHTAAMTLTVQGDLLLRSGQSEKAEMSLQKSLALGRMVHDSWGMSFALSGLARLWQSRANFETAKRCLEDSFRLRESLGDFRRAARTLNRLGWLLREQAKLGMAVAVFKQAVHLCQRYQIEAELVTANLGLAEIARSEQRFAEAIALVQEALKLAINARRQPQIVEILYTFGNLLAEIDHQELSVAPLIEPIEQLSNQVLGHYFLNQARANEQPLSREKISNMVGIFFAGTPSQLLQA